MQNMQNKIIAIILVSILFIFFFYTPQHINVWNATFLHLNFFHLALNSVTLYSLYTSQLNRFKPYIIIPASYFIAVIAFYVSNNTSIGASAAILALFGFMLAKHINKHNSILTILIIVLSFLPGIDTTAHIMAIFLSFFIGCFFNLINFILRNV